MDVGVELDLDLAGDRAGRAVGALGRSIESRRFAERAVERRLRRRDRSLPRRSPARISSGPRIPFCAACSVHQFIPVLAMVMRKSSTTKAPSSRAMTRARSR